MHTIIFATKNKGKLKEIREIMSDTDYNIISMEDAGIDTDILEDGATFEENALKKASEIMKASGKIVLADDSGIEIDFLDKKPGVYSARYMGCDTPYPVKNAKILDILEGVPLEKRTARFVCVVAAVFPDGKEFMAKGTIEGTISFEILGENGFGYDPIFYVEQYKMTTAQMSAELKNSISHRGQALRLIKEKLTNYL